MLFISLNKSELSAVELGSWVFFQKWGFKIADKKVIQTCRFARTRGCKNKQLNSEFEIETGNSKNECKREENKWKEEYIMSILDISSRIYIPLLDTSLRAKQTNKTICGQVTCEI